MKAASKEEGQRPPLIQAGLGAIMPAGGVVHLLEQGGCDCDEELRGVGRLQDGTPGISDQTRALAGRLDVIELLLHVVHSPNIPQHLPR